MVERPVGDKRLRLVRGDITDMDVEAFVFDITEDVKLGAGYGGAIVARAGKTVQEELNTVGSCPPGEAVLTGGGRLKAKHIVHVNGPKFRPPDEEALLRRTTLAALRRAEDAGIEQLALPPIGAGLYQVPLDVCARVMVETVSAHLSNSSRLKEVVFVALDQREYAPLAVELQKGA